MVVYNKRIDYLASLGFTKYYIQDGDMYTFRPDDRDFYDMKEIKERLLKTVPKKDWGMIWCK